MLDPTVRRGCTEACQLCRLCGDMDQRIPRELREELGAAAVGMSYAELEQFDPSSDYYDPDVGPYAWEV